MKKMTILYKISYSALFIAIGIILSRLVSLPNLFGLPFLKVSLNPSIVMFSSFYLGPLWGLLVGTFCDVFGALLIPQGGAFNPIFTIPASLTGLMPYLLYKIFDNRFEKKFPISLTIILTIVTSVIVLYFSLNNHIFSESGKKDYILEDYQRFLIIFGSIILSILYILGVIFVKKKFSRAKLNLEYNVYTIATAILLTYFVFKIPTSSLIKSFVLNFPFWFVYLIQNIVGLFACFIHIILVIMLLNVTTFFNTKGVLVKNNNKDVEETYGKKE